MRSLLRFNTIIIIFLLVVNCSEKIDDPYLLSLKEQGVDVIIYTLEDIPVVQPYDIEVDLVLGGDVEDPVLMVPGRCFADDDGNMYISDERRIEKFDSNGKFLHYISDIGQGPGELEYPMIIRLSSDNIILRNQISGEGNISKYSI